MALTFGVKSTLLIAGMAITAGAAGKPNVIVQDVKLNKATIFLRGAELSNSTTLNLPAGDSDIILTNVAGNINPGSLSVMLNNDDVIIQSVNLRSEIEKPVYSDEINALKIQIEEQDLAIQQLNMQTQVNNEQLGLLRDQDFFGTGGAPLTQEQSVQKLDFIRSQMAKIYAEQLEYTRQIKEKTEALTLLKAQYEEKIAQFKERRTQLVLNVSAKKAVTAELDIDYITPDAAWAPSYDIRSAGMDEPVILTYKADVIQNTGIGWDQVDLVLSSADPVQSIAPPQLYPWYLSLMREYGVLAEMAPAPAPVMMADADYRRNRMAKKAPAGGISSFVTAESNGISLTYTIDKPYSLPSVPESRSLTIKQTSLDGKYRYITRPKMDEHVYLQAVAGNAPALNLLSGKANIYFDNRYIGQTYIDSGLITNELELPFGMNKDIQVSRKVDNKLTKQPGILGSAVEQTEGYLITLSSFAKAPLVVTVFDQIPVSRDTNILVKDIGTGEGTVNKQTGEVEWTVELKPQQTMELPLNYTLKYPKDKPVNGL
ncbi:mucoidy inhibitor MuiA family protein [Morganella morganii]|nr:mucoidy inhibitor MuiA family protein [Morganella morganii]